MHLAARAQPTAAHNSLSAAGVGRTGMSRKEMFRERSGVAVTMETPVFQTLPCNGILRGNIMAQNLPSLVAAHVLAPKPGSRVCDMCAAPGGAPRRSEYRQISQLSCKSWKVLITLLKSVPGSRGVTVGLTHGRLSQSIGCKVVGTQQHLVVCGLPHI